MSKQYGLSFPKKGGHQIGQVTATKLSIFDEDSDNEEPPKLPTGVTKGLKKQDKISQEKAVADDPTVYQYDEVYDDIEKKRTESKLAKQDVDKKPKYINRLLAAAEKRKRENDRRIERQVQREREEEGDMFKDKESFITPSYKKKLEEMRELEEQEKREEYLESIGDVRKQGNLDGFYRHLYDQKVNFKENETKTEEDPETTNEEIKEKVKEEQESEHEEERHSEPENTEQSKEKIRKRKYRSRKNSEEESDSEEEPEVKKEHIQSNIDADSDFSINSSDSEEEKETEQQEKEEDKIKSEKTPPSETQNDTAKENKEKPSESVAEIKKPEVKAKPTKPKVDIWKKRTVGEKFDEAVKRYFERKALRESNSF